MQKFARLPIKYFVTSRGVFAALIILTLLLTLCYSTFASGEPANLGLHKIQLERYYSSGHYISDIKARIREATYYLQFRIIQNKRLKHPHQLAIVLDIDETSLSNYEDLRRFQFGGTPDEIEAANADGHDEGISPTLSLYDYALKNKVAVFFVTGRKEYERKRTETNLKNAGYSNWTKLYLEPNNYNKSSVVPFKVACRMKISQAYDIVLNIGDQYSDLKGGYADRTIKLPNPYYYLN